MEIFKEIIGFVTALISLVAALISLKAIRNKDEPAIHIQGKSNTVYQDNSVRKDQTTNINTESKTIVYVSSGNRTTSNDDSTLLIIGTVLLLGFLYVNRVILLQIMYVPLIISALLSVLISIFYKKGLYITPIHPKLIINVLFALTPVIVSFMFVLQNYLFLSNNEAVELLDKIKIASTICFNYLGMIFLLLSQLCVLLVSHFKYPKLKRIMLNFARLWPAAIILPLVSIMIWLIPRQQI